MLSAYILYFITVMAICPVANAHISHYLSYPFQKRKLRPQMTASGAWLFNMVYQPRRSVSFNIRSALSVCSIPRQHLFGSFGFAVFFIQIGQHGICVQFFGCFYQFFISATLPYSLRVQFFRPRKSVFDSRIAFRKKQLNTPRQPKAIIRK